MKATIQIEVRTRERLYDHGKKGQTFDQIINSLIDKVEAQPRSRVREVITA